MQPAAQTNENAAGTLASSGTQPELVRRLVDVLSLPAGRQTQNERAFVADVLASLMATADIGLRREVAERMTAVGSPPGILLRRLLHDQIDVAEPLLTRLKEIGEPLLVEVAGQTAEHRSLIAKRDDLTPAVAEALLDWDEGPVIAAILRRTEVALSPERIEQLLFKSRHDAEVRTLLLARPELQSGHGFTMFWWASTPQRQRILSRFAIDRTVIQDTLQPMYRAVFTAEAPDPVVKRLLHLIDRRHRPRGRNGETVTMDVVEKTLTVARAVPTGELCEAVGLLAGISTDCATRVMLDGGGEPFSILAKSIGVSRGAFTQILEGAAGLPKDGTGPEFDAERREHLVATFDTIARDYARTVLRYWDWRPDAEGFGTAESASGDDGGYFGAV
ncbi:DUF2336 domain-containing protein [Parvularcula dongshanensis]|uniref:Uncharacterized protein (DUF2336 family) n=1 Tax=Parvularcula dongshanensis TaxID=1173995 RepID=A0A840I113_9PROT|nr:DUF2336 domain-containing protein [Parvularcula dongshanensis]MBB4658519.1 uncharacterized protein (DUF2336 family) [Parvularcula dongshanensis]